MIYPGKTGSPKSQIHFYKRSLQQNQAEIQIPLRLLSPCQHSSLKNVPIFKSSNGISSKHTPSINEVNQQSPSVQKFFLMQNMIEQLLDRHPIDNRQINDGLIYLLSIVQNITKQKYKQRARTKSQINNDEIKQFNTLVDQSTKMNSTLTKLIQISKTRQIKDGLSAVKQIQDKIMNEILNLKVSTNSKIDSNDKVQKLRSSYRGSEIEIMKLKQQKIQLLQELNNEIQISNRKSEQIKYLQSKLSELNKLPKQQSNRMVRCLSTNIVPSKQVLDSNKISMLIKQNESLKKQIKQMKQFSISQSFISQAFNFRQKQISNEKNHYQTTIKQLKTKIVILQAKLSKNTSNQKSENEFYTGENKNFKDSIKKLEQQKGNILKQLEHYKDCCRILRQEITKLKAQNYEIPKSTSNNRSKYHSPDYRKVKTKNFYA